MNDRWRTLWSAHKWGVFPHSPKPSRCTIGWLAVTETHRQCGIGRALVDRVFELVQPTVECEVTTFGADRAEGAPERRFYAQMGFHPAEPAPDGLEGGSRQVFRRIMS